MSSQIINCRSFLIIEEIVIYDSKMENAKGNRLKALCCIKVVRDHFAKLTERAIAFLIYLYDNSFREH